MPVAKECRKNILAVHDALDVISGKWRISILASLIMKSELNFSGLKEELPSISSKVLSDELRNMEENNLITREVIKKPVGKVKYRLTAYGRTLEDPIFLLMDWGFTHRFKMLGNKSVVNNIKYIQDLKENLPPLSRPNN